MPITHRPSMSGTVFNRLAGDYLHEKRLKLGLSQPEFADELSRLVELPVSPSSLHYYEAGKHAIPAAVLLAAQSMKTPRRRIHGNRHRARVSV